MHNYLVFIYIYIFSTENLFLKIDNFTAQKFFKDDPRSDKIASSDRIEILQLDTQGKVYEQEVLRNFQANMHQLIAHVHLPALLPHLHSRLVLSKEEAEVIMARAAGEEANRTLLELVQSKSTFWVVQFAECLKESPQHQCLTELLFPPSPPLPPPLQCKQHTTHTS